MAGNLSRADGARVLADLQALRAIGTYKTGVHRPTFSPEDIEDYVHAQLQPGALTGALNWYRAAVRGGGGRFAGSPRPIEVPTLVLWGDADRYLEPWLADPPSACVTHCTVRHFPGASHWLMADRPDDVNAALMEHMQ